MNAKPIHAVLHPLRWMLYYLSVAAMSLRDWCGVVVRTVAWVDERLEEYE